MSSNRKRRPTTRRPASKPAPALQPPGPQPSPRGWAALGGGCFLLGLAMSLLLALAGRRPAVLRGAPATDGGNGQIESLLAAGQQSMDAARYNDAMAPFEQAIAIEPGDARAYIGRAAVLHRVGRDQEAVRELRTALERDPRSVVAKITLAQYVGDSGDTPEAIGLLEQVLAAEPGHYRARLLLGQNLLRAGRAREAVALLEGCAQEQPRSALEQAYLGRARAEAGDVDGAMRALSRALELDPRLARAHFWMADLLAAAGRDSEAERAIEAFRQCQQLDAEIHRLRRTLLRQPDDYATLVQLARAHVARGRYPDALIPLERAIALRPDEPQLRKIEAMVRDAIRQQGPTSGPLSPTDIEP